MSRTTGYQWTEARAVSDPTQYLPATAWDYEEVIDLIFDLFDLFDLIVDVFRNLGNYLSGI